MTLPYVIAKCAMSLDACLDDESETRLILSHPTDFDRVDDVRAACDAILVGANTIRKDNPRLMVRSDARSQQRVADGRPPQPVKVTVTKSGRLDPTRAFFTAGPAERVVYTSGSVEDLSAVVGVATIVPLPADAALTWLLEDLARRGVRKLLVEGGSEILTWFLAENAVDELQVSIAPFFLAEASAVRVVGVAKLPFSKDLRMPLKSVEQVGDMVVAVYQLKPQR